MPKKSELHCLVPGLINAFKGLKKTQSGDFSAIDYFFSRADSNSYEKDYPHALSEAVGLDLNDNLDLPTAAIQANHLLADKNNSTWIEAYPVNLLPDRDKLFLKPVDASYKDALNSKTINELTEKFAEYFDSDISRVLLSPEGSWLLQLESPCSIQTRYWQDVIGQHIQNYLPWGDDQKKWRSLMNEMQMFLHMHDAEQIGFNALWFNGVGEIPVQPNAPASEFCSDDFLTQSLATYLDMPFNSSVESTFENTKQPDRLIYTDTRLMLDFMTQSLGNMTPRLENLDKLLSHAIASLKRKTLDKVMLYGFSNQRYTLTLRGVYSFWRNRQI